MQTTMNVRRYAPHSAMPLHDHAQASFGIVVGGDFEERVGRSERRYCRGTVTYCPAGVAHEQRFGPKGAQQIIVRPQDSWIAYLAEARGDLGGSPYAQDIGFVRLGERLLEELRAGDRHAAFAREGIVLEIVALFGRGLDGAERKLPRWLSIARDYLEAHACTSFSMAEVARAAGRHEIHLAREFRRHFGLSMGAYVRRLRIEEAARLLQRPDADISAVALVCGFSSHAHLCREFKAQMGLTPSQFRAEAR